MAEWKQRGYVPDSDEEEEEESQNSIYEQTPTGKIRSNDNDDREIHQTYEEEEHSARSEGQDHSHGELRNRIQPETCDLEKGKANDNRQIKEPQQDRYRDTAGTQLRLELEAHVIPKSGQGRASAPAVSTSQQASRTSRASSVLSDAPSSLPDFPTLLRLETENDGGPSEPENTDARVASSSLDIALGRGQEPVEDSNDLSETRNGGRSFRHRNPIQLHPYLLEKQKFNQVQHSHGLKGIRFEEEAVRTRRQEAESQDFDYSDDEDVLNPSPPAFARAPPSSQNIRQEEVFEFENDEGFPDINALLQTSSRDLATYSHKRRKLNPELKRPPKILPPRQQTLAPDRPHGLPEDDNARSDVPPLPPLSESLTPLRPKSPAASRFRVPPGLASPNPPTPATSSEPRRRQCRPTALDNSSQEGTPVPVQNQDVFECDISSSEDDVSHLMERAQRRIKGVLPASWLKLDLKTQAKKPLQNRWHPLSISPEKAWNQRGVARPVVRYGSKTPRSRQELFILSDDDSIATDADQPPPLERSRAGFDTFANDQSTFTSRWREALEDDSIDAMLLPVSRPRQHPTRNKKRQTKMADFGVQRKHTAHKPRTEHHQKQRVHRPMINSDKSHRAEARPKPRRQARLSILDAPRSQGTERAPRPAFVNIAERTARKRQDEGRHTPSRKYLRLASREDTQDVNDTLLAWREGTIAPNVSHDTQSTRLALQPRSANTATPFRPSESAESPRQVKIALSARRSVQPRPRSTNPRKLQSSLDNLVRRRAPERWNARDRPPLADQEPNQREGRRKRGQLLSNLQTLNDSRPAMLETSQTEEDRLHPQSAFRRGLSTFNKSSHETQLSKPVLERFLCDGEDPLETSHTTTTLIKDSRLEPVATITSSAQPRRLRKRCPRRLDVTVRSCESPSPALVDELPDDGAFTIPYDTSHAKTITGLGPFGTKYSSTFDITPLPPGTCFHWSTLLGSGELQKSLRLTDSNLDTQRGSNLLTFSGKTFRWGPWNEIVSSEIGEVLGQVTRAIQSLGQPESALRNVAIKDGISLLKAIISYFSVQLSFLDPVDRTSFLQRCRLLFSTFLEDCNPYINVTDVDVSTSPNSFSKQSGYQVSTLGLVISNQLLQISEHDVVPSHLKDDIKSLLSTSAKKALFAILTGLGDFDQCLSRLNRRGNAEFVIGEDLSSIEALVVAHHVLRQADLQALDTWDAIRDVAGKPTDKAPEVGSNEQSWRQLFVVLPFLEFGEKGVLEIGRRFRSPLGNWILVKRLVNPVLDKYVANPSGQAAGFNAYCRALFSRCLHLINGWGWYRCDSIIGALFDFFAKNSLGHLRNEESRGSPSFLENLNKNPVLDAEPEDRCFHLLLKIIGSGLKHMQQLCPPKKIRDLAWRLMPNHGRSHPKDQAIRQEDLDALRNHHDLLCTLYWASPLGFRPSLSAIRTLVDLERSHRETCHISIRAWFNLVKFQLSTDEPNSSLAPFTQWHTDFLQQMLRQHSLARTEAEEHAQSAQHVSGLSISKELLELTIAKNQRQVEAVLSDALVCLELAIATAKTQEAAGLLLSPAVARAFGLFDSSRTQANAVVTKALDVLLAYATKCSIKNQRAMTHSNNEDSQDYGDWSAFNDDALEAGPLKRLSVILQELTGPLRNLLSNCFGADSMPQETLLSKLTDTWVGVNAVFVNDGVKSWDDCIGQFGNDSWNTLRDTEQSRKYTAYFFAALIEMDVHIYRDNRVSILTSWLGSLVERESLLKFQHKFTNALLNADSNDPILANLPFWKNTSGNGFDITPTEFSQRRLCLISSILSNMRMSLENAAFDPTTDNSQLKQEYKDLLRHLMTIMKHTYSELGHGSNIKGAYVGFVHRVVELLQEHTSSICPVDRFFTDNASFPLPATDPMYVVGQLKNYGLRLLDLKTPKQLTVFLQSVSERAVADSQQAYLVEQLSTAMTNTFEDENIKPTLRAFLVKAIVPAYVQMAFETPVGWVLAVPFLQALQKVFNRVAVDLDGFNTSSVDNIRSTMMAFMSCTQSAMTPLANHARYFESASILKLLAACYDVVTALLPTLDYLFRLKPGGTEDLVLEQVAFFNTFADCTRCTLAPRGPNDIPKIDPSSLPPVTTDAPHNDIHNFAVRELQDALSKSWTRVGNDYFVTRGSLRREVIVNVGSVEGETEALVEALRGFEECLGRLSALGGQDGGDEAARRVQRTGDCEGLFC